MPLDSFWPKIHDIFSVVHYLRVYRYLYAEAGEHQRKKMANELLLLFR